MILAIPNGNLVSCLLVRETAKAWYVNYRDTKYSGEKRIAKDGDRQLFLTVDEALDWLRISYDE